MLRAGTIFVVEDATDIGLGFRVRLRGGTYQDLHVDDPCAAELVAALEPLPEKPSDWMKRIDWQGYAPYVLDELEAAGIVTREAIEKALAKVRES